MMTPSPETDLPDEQGVDVDEFLDSLGEQELRDLLAELADSNSQVREDLHRRALLERADGGEMEQEVTRTVRSLLSRGQGPIGYYESSGYAWDVETVLRGIADMVSAPGGADAARNPLRRLIWGLGDVLEHADDSNGEISAARQEAVDMLIRACDESSWTEDQRRELGSWMVNLRMTDGFGVDGLTLEALRSALGTAGIEGVRGEVAAWSNREDARGYEFDRLRLELADHDEDVDEAIRILAGGEFPGYGAIIRRLLDGGRIEEAVNWVRRAIAEGRLTMDPYFTGTSSWVDADLAVDLLAEHGGLEEAVDASHSLFLKDLSRRPTVFTWLLDAAERLGVRDRERQWALDAVAERARASGRADDLIVVRLADDDPEGAWEAADRYGPGYAWRKLVDEAGAVRPHDAAELVRRDVASRLTSAGDRRLYASCAADLKKMCRLFARAGEAPQGTAVVRSLMEEYRRRPAMLEEFRRAGLG